MWGLGTTALSRTVLGRLINVFSWFAFIPPSFCCFNVCLRGVSERTDTLKYNLMHCSPFRASLGGRHNAALKRDEAYSGYSCVEC